MLKQVELQPSPRAPQPELAAALRARADLITRSWQEAVKRHLPAADELTFAQLRDDLPTILDQLAVALETGSPVTQGQSASAGHGTTRFHQDYNLAELFVEYDLLRETVLENLGGHLARPLSFDETATVSAVVSTAMRRGVMAFVEHLSGQLQAAAENHSKYLSFLSHDLRGSLNGIVLMLEFFNRELQHHPQFSSLIEDLDMMRRSILDTVATMDRFLQAERLRKGKVPVRLAEVSLEQVIRDAATHFRYEAREKGVELRFDVTPGLTWVTDPSLLNLILHNLISNGIKYGRRGEVRITAGEQDTKDGPVCMISVVDQGAGIDPEQLSELFAPFTRGETHGEPGVGLGLTIALQSVELLGATLWAESKPGEGSAFHLQLPKRDGPPAS